jgi:hypothetical protein
MNRDGHFFVGMLAMNKGATIENTVSIDEEDSIKLETRNWRPSSFASGNQPLTDVRP